MVFVRCCPNMQLKIIFRFIRQIIALYKSIIPHTSTFFNPFPIKFPSAQPHQYPLHAGVEIPINCLWHSHKSRRNPNGISHTSSDPRCSCAVNVGSYTDLYQPVITLSEMFFSPSPRTTAIRPSFAGYTNDARKQSSVFCWRKEKTRNTVHTSLWHDPCH